MKKVFMCIILLTATGCAANPPKADLQQKAAWVPCEVEVVAYADTGKTVARAMKTQWFCENR